MPIVVLHLLKELEGFVHVLGGLFEAGVALQFVLDAKTHLAVAELRHAAAHFLAAGIADEGVAGADVEIDVGQRLDLPGPARAARRA